MLEKLENIKFKELSAAVKILNASDCLEKPIVVVGNNKESIVNEFVNAVQNIPDKEGTDEWSGPDEVAIYYNKIVLDDEEEGSNEEEAEGAKNNGEPEPEAEPKAGAKAEPKAKKASEPKKDSRLTIAGRVIRDLKKKADIEEIAGIANDLYSGTDNEKEAKWACKVAISVLEAYGAIVVKDGKIGNV